MTDAADAGPDPKLVERLETVKRTLRCPHCDEPLTKTNAPPNPFSGWESPYLYICLNNACPYYVRSEETLAAQGVPGGAYRFVFDPLREWCGPVATKTLGTLRG